MSLIVLRNSKEDECAGRAEGFSRMGRSGCMWEWRGREQSVRDVRSLRPCRRDLSVACDDTQLCGLRSMWGDLVKKAVAVANIGVGAEGHDRAVLALGRAVSSSMAICVIQPLFQPSVHAR